MLLLTAATMVHGPWSIVFSNFFSNKRNYLNLTIVKEHQTLNVLAW